jgi:amino acid transporter
MMSIDFPGYGSYDVRATPQRTEMDEIAVSMDNDLRGRHLLSELESTAIAGNDILSSTFYVSGLVTLAAGKMAPVCLALVGFVLYLFRGIYHETITALPVNGGTYSLLLNCTSKQTASIAAVLNIIAYITTGAVSGLDAIAYLKTAIPTANIDHQTGTIFLLSFFCLLTNCGMQESATFAKYIFLIHLATLSILTLIGTTYMYLQPELLFENWQTPYPSISFNIVEESDISQGTMTTAIIFGFSSAMLGVSGFETSAQFVEEQAPGVFPKTLRNMWAGVMFFNPILSLISFACLPVSAIIQNKETVLAKSAEVLGYWIQEKLHISAAFNVGHICSTIVSIDAFIVLAAAVLTSFIGINGLIRRMSMDRCLPQILLTQNPWTGTDSYILVGFFVLCVSQVVVLKCNVAALGGVYCFSFLAVMMIFAIGNIMLKVKRPSLPREISVPWIQAIAGLLSIAVAFLGNVVAKADLLQYFFVYCIIIGSLVFIMFQQVRITRFLYKMLLPRSVNKHSSELSLFDLESVPESVQGITSSTRTEGDITISSSNSNSKDKKTCRDALGLALKEIKDVPFVFFCKHDDLPLMNKIILYIKRNEQTHKIIIVHCAKGAGTDTDMLGEHVKLLDLLYPKIKISLLVIDSPFSPSTVEWTSQRLSVPLNAMFISCPDENFSMKVHQLRGMRIVTSYH